MKYSLLSLVAGNIICNARCPFCISKMTPPQGVSQTKQEIDWRNFHKAAELARSSGVQTVMITGKGEPTLFPEQITEYLFALKDYGFPFIELQTNGILFEEKKERYQRYLREWYELGLTTIAISIVHYQGEENRKIYLPHRAEYINLEELIGQLHRNNFTVRLACVLCKGIVDSGEKLNELVSFSKKNQVEQLAIRPVNSPGGEASDRIHRWVAEHSLSEEQIAELRGYIQREGNWLYDFPHGGALYDIRGQNICITNSLTKANSSGEVRQLIFFPDGTLSFDWEFEGALLLRGRYRAQEKRESTDIVLPLRRVV